MPRHIVEGPDGKRHIIEAPDGATPDDVMSFLNRQSSQPTQQASESGAMGWGDVASSAVRNAPRSAYNLGKSIVDAVTSPVETATALYNVGKGGVSKAAGAIGIDQDPGTKAQNEAAFDAVASFFADRYGGVENFKKTLAEDPVGFAADLSSVLGVAGTVSRVPAISRAASIIDPIRAAGGAATKVGKSVVEPIVSHGVGTLSGVGAEPLRIAARAGRQGNKTLLDNMRGVSSLNDSIDMAQSALGQIKRERGDAYRAGMEAVRADKTLLQMTPLRDAIAEATAKTQRNGFVIDDVAAKTAQEIADKFEQFRTSSNTMAYRTADGLDAFKQAVGEIRQRAQPGTLSRHVADSVYNAVKSQIVKQVPEYAKTMDAYSNASDHINDIQKTFALSEKAAPDTTARRLASVLRNNVNTNFGNRTRLMDDLARYEPDLPVALAGQTLSSPTPRGLAGLGAIGQAGAGLMSANPAVAGPLVASSPRLMGEAAYHGGRGVGAVSDAAQKTGMTSRRLAQMLLALYQADQVSEPLRGGIGPRYDEFGNPR